MRITPTVWSSMPATSAVTAKLRIAPTAIKKSEAPMVMNRSLHARGASRNGARLSSKGACAPLATVRPSAGGVRTNAGTTIAAPASCTCAIVSPRQLPRIFAF